MTSEHQWDASLEVGKNGADLFKLLLDAQGVGWKDVQNDDAYRAIDVDFLVPRRIPYEVKHDTFDSQNIAIEVSVDLKPGWFFKSRAEVIVIVKPAHRCAYELRDRLALWIWAFQNPQRTFYSMPKSTRGASKWPSVAMMLPIAPLLEAGLLTQVRIPTTVMEAWLHGQKTTIRPDTQPGIQAEPLPEPTAEPAVVESVRDGPGEADSGEGEGAGDRGASPARQRRVAGITARRGPLDWRHNPSRRSESPRDAIGPTGMPHAAHRPRLVRPGASRRRRVRLPGGHPGGQRQRGAPTGRAV